VRLLGDTGGVAPLESLTTSGTGSLFVGGNITTNGHSQDYGTPVVLTANAVVTEENPTGEITFGATLDAMASGAAGLTLVSQGVVTFSAPVGASGALSSVKTDPAGTTVFNGGLVSTVGAQSYAGTVHLSSDTDFNTSGGSLTFGSIDGNGHNIVVEAGVGGGATTVQGAVSNLGSGTGAALTVASGVTGQVEFDGPLSTNGGLSLPASVSTLFRGDVALGNGGAATQLPGPVQLAGISFSSYGGLTFGPLTLSGGPVTISSMNAGAITMAGTVNGAQGLTVNTAGTTAFGGDVGLQAALLTLTTGAGAGTTLDGSLHTTGGASFGGALSITAGGNQALTSDQGALTVAGALQKTGAGNLTLTSGGALALGGDVTLESGALTLDAPTISAAGDLSAQGITATHALTLDGSGGQTLAAGTGAFSASAITKAAGALTLSGASASLGGDIATHADLTLTFASIALQQDVAVTTGNGNLSLAGSVGGDHALKLDAGSGAVTVAGAIGTGAASLASFSANGSSISLLDVFTSGDQTYTYAPAGLLLLDGSTYQATAGNINLNSTNTPRTAIPDVATIAKSNLGDITVSAGGSVSMGLYEKFSVLGGNLEIDAGGKATLSDLSVAGALQVRAASITLLTRAPARVLVSTGEEEDLGLDFVASTIAFLGPTGDLPIAGNLISFQTDTVLRNYTVRFATADGKANVPLYPGFSFYTLPDSYFTDDRLIASFLFGPLDNAYLDLRPIGFNRANVDSALPPAAPAPPESVNITYEVPAALRDDLEKLGIFARPDTELVLQPADPATPIYDATIKSDDRSPERFRVADVRISSTKALAAIRTYREIFEERTADGRVRNRVDQIQRLLTGAFIDYRRATGASDPRGFRRYLEEHGGPALTYLNQLRSLLQRIGQMGLTPNEFSISRTYVLRSIRIPGLPLQALREAVDPESLGLAGHIASAQ